MSVPSLRSLWKPILVVAALAFVYWSVLAKLGRDWWYDDNYSHGLLIPFVIGYMVWADRDRFSRVDQKPWPVLGGAVMVLAMLALWAGTAGAELFVQRMSLLVMVAGLVVYFWGLKLFKLVLLPLFLFALAIPIPAILFNKIALPLQLFASKCAVWAMRVFDIPVLREGNIIELMPLGARSTKRLEVVEACSGIRSLMTLVTLAVVLAYFTHHSRDADGGGNAGSPFTFLKRFGSWRAVILVLSAVPIAILTNAARVSGTGILAHYYGTEVADSFFHGFSGWVVYIVAFVLLLGVSWLLDRAGGLGSGKGDSGGGRAVATAREAKVVDGSKSTPAASAEAYTVKEVN